MKCKNIKINIQVIEINRSFFGETQNKNYAAYINFEDSVLDNLVFRGYDLEETYGDSTEKGKYLQRTYVKESEGAKLRILVMLQLIECFTYKTNVKEGCAKSVGDDGVYIIVNDNSYTSYENALRYFEASLDEFEVK